MSPIPTSTGHTTSADHSSNRSSHPSASGSVSVLLATMALTLVIALTVITLAAMNSPLDPAQASAILLAATTA